MTKKIEQSGLKKAIPSTLNRCSTLETDDAVTPRTNPAVQNQGYAQVRIILPPTLPMGLQCNRLQMRITGSCLKSTPMEKGASS